MIQWVGILVTELLSHFPVVNCHLCSSNQTIHPLIHSVGLRSSHFFGLSLFSLYKGIVIHTAENIVEHVGMLPKAMGMS